MALMPTYSDATVVRAKRDGLYLFRCELNGKHAKASSLGISRTLTKDQVNELEALLSKWMAAESNQPKE